MNKNKSKSFWIKNLGLISFVLLISGSLLSTFTFNLTIKIIGFALFAIGLIIENRKPWSTLSKNEKRNRIIKLIVFIAILVVAFIIFMWQVAYTISYAVLKALMPNLTSP